VREATVHPVVGPLFHRVLFEELVPGSGLDREDALRFAEQVWERFRNPFLAHRIADIANDHDAKLAKRVGEFLCWVSAAANPPAMPELAKLASHAGAPVS